MPRPALALALALVASLAACAGTQTAPAGDGRATRSAEDEYKAGVEQLDSKNYVEATTILERVRSKYPFSKYATLAELRLADAKFNQDRFVEAIEAYRQFLKLHPTHDEADYAAYRVALSHWRDGPSDFVFFPPSYEKDLTQVRDARRAIDDFLKSYPSSRFRPEAEKLKVQARKMLSEHEWYVAGFYAKRGHWAGVASRLEALVKEYPDDPRDAEALLGLAQAWVKLDERYRAQQALQQLIVKHPDDPRRAQAEQLLASLR